MQAGGLSICNDGLCGHAADSVSACEWHLSYGQFDPADPGRKRNPDNPAVSKALVRIAAAGAHKRGSVRHGKKLYLGRRGHDFSTAGQYVLIPFLYILTENDARWDNAFACMV